MRFVLGRPSSLWTLGDQKRGLARLGDVLHEARMKIAADKANKEASKDADAASEAEEGEVV